MVESHTKKSLGELLVKVALDKLNRWAYTEISNLNHKIKSPICVPLNKNSWLVGNYKIICNQEYRYSVISDNSIIHSFKNKQAAFFYALLDKCHLYELSRQLLLSDQLCARLEEEKQIFSSKLKKYKKRSNSFKEQLLEARLSEVNIKLKHAKQDLEKNLNAAKYVKVWD